MTVRRQGGAHEARYINYSLMEWANVRHRDWSFCCQPFCLRSQGLSQCHKVTDCSAYYSDVIMTVMASQITSLTVVYSTVYSDADQRKHQGSASLAFVWGHKGPVTRKMFSFDDVIMVIYVRRQQKAVANVWTFTRIIKTMYTTKYGKYFNMQYNAWQNDLRGTFLH